jgi:hypothetical protein
MRGLINSPTPTAGNPQPATPGGTASNAAVPPVAPYNPVASYLTTDLNTGAPLVVNITGAGSFFSPGYVARSVSNGQANTYGEGSAIIQSDMQGVGTFFNLLGNEYVWGEQMSQVIASSKSVCGCQN